MYKIQLIKIDKFSILLKTIYLSTLAYPSMASFSQGRHDSIKKKLYTAINNKTNNFVGFTMYLLKTFLSFWSVTRGVFREVQTLNIY